MILKIEKLWLHEKQIIYMEKGSYHTLKSITLELGVLEIRHLRCDGFFAVHVLKLYLLLKLNYSGRVPVTFLKKIEVKKSGMQR